MYLQDLVRLREVVCYLAKEVLHSIFYNLDWHTEADLCFDVATRALPIQSSNLVQEVGTVKDFDELLDSQASVE